MDNRFSFKFHFNLTEYSVEAAELSEIRLSILIIIKQRRNHTQVKTLDKIKLKSFATKLVPEFLNHIFIQYGNHNGNILHNSSETGFILA